MVLALKETELKTEELFDSLEKKLPLDILYNIYTFCNVNEKKKITQYIFRRHDIVILASLLTFSAISYFVGYLVTKKFLGFFIILNFLLGYLIISVFTLIIIVFYLLLKSCFKVTRPY